MGRPSGPHVVLSMDFEEPALPAVGKDRRQMLVLEARSGDAAQGQGKAEGNGRRRSPDCCLHVAPPPLCSAAPAADSNWPKRTVLSARQLNAGASAALHELPGIALKIGGRRALAGRARSRRAVILALQRDAETFLFLGGYRRIGLGLGQGTGYPQGRERGGHGPGEDERTDDILGRHEILLSMLL